MLHATFDLDATRNQINDTEKNRFILKKTVDFTINVAKHLSQGIISYTPLKILFHKHKADTLLKFDYYALIEKAIKEQAVFPSIGGTYITLGESFFVSNEAAELLQAIGGERFFDCHLIPANDELILKIFSNCQIDDKFSVFTDYQKDINALAALKMSYAQRAMLIKIIAQNFKSVNDKFKRFNLLVDDSNELIDANDDIYTPPTNENSLQVPSYAKIQFINNKLFDALVQCYKRGEYEPRGKARFIYDILKDHCNIHSFEPIALAEKIIRITNEALEKTLAAEDKAALVKKMNQCLYHNYKTQSDRTKLTIDNIPSITKKDSIRRISELYLSIYYPTGKNVELIFEGIYKDPDYIASPDILGFPSDELKENVEAFLVWLG